ncbi:MAG: BatA domain-containing protein [Phycisphaerae bacterium]
MLTWAHPWVLVGLLAVAGVAAWALLRRDRQQATVATLAFWRAAREHLSAARQRRTRRVSADWLVLLLGAVCAILAAAGPAMRWTGPARHIALRLVTSAELGEDGMVAMVESASALLDRLDSTDRVTLLTPTGSHESLSPSEARGVIASLQRQPLAAEDIALPPPPEDAQAVFTFAPAGARGDRPTDTLVALPADVPPVTFDAIGATDLPGDGAELFVALRNHTDQPRRESVTLEGLLPGGRREWGRTAEIVIPAGRRESLTLKLPGTSAAIVVSIRSGLEWDSAQLARREGRVLPVAMLGPDRRGVRRFVEADPMLELVADANDADAVIAIRANPPPGKPALLLAPPNPPRGWRTGQARGPLTLAAADVAADDAVMRNVELAALAVREVRPWVPTDETRQVRLVSLDGDALALRSSDTSRPRRVWIAIDPTPEDTDLALHYPMLIWLHNAMSFLLGETGTPDAVYESISATAGHPGWTPVHRGSRPSENVLAPGVYSAGQDDLRAVNLLGLRGGRTSADPVARAKGLPLPTPTTLETPVELGWVLATLAGMCWLAGWWLRVGGGGFLVRRR